MEFDCECYRKLENLQWVLYLSLKEMTGVTASLEKLVGVVASSGQN